jgi:subtilisin family serine protease
MTFAAPRLTNTMVVENRVNTPGTADRRPEPGCLSGNDFGGTQLGGTISAMGTDVWSFTGRGTGAAAFTGTSMAMPQVAAVAAHAWSLDPSRDAQGVIDLVRASSRAIGGDATAGFTCHERHTNVPGGRRPPRLILSGQVWIRPRP